MTIQANWTVNPCGTITSVLWQGVNYDVIGIGNQCWFSENLRYTPENCLNAPWDNSFNACRTHNTDWGTETLYQWKAAMNGFTTEGAQGLCPAGWRIPTDNELTALNNYLGLNSGQKLKSTNPSWGGTNEVGFNAKPAGYRMTNGIINQTGLRGGFWSSFASGEDARGRHLTHNNTSFDLVQSSQATGTSVRCILWSGWTGTHTVTYNADGGTCSPASRTVNHGSNADGPSCSKAGHILNNFTITNGICTGFDASTGACSNVQSNMTIQANWTAVTGVNYGTAFQWSYPNLYSLAYPSGIPADGMISAGNHNFNTNVLHGATSSVRNNVVQNTIGRGFAYIYSGTQTYSMATPISLNSWSHVLIRGGGMTTNVYVGSFNFVFENGAVLTPQNAINQGYIEPLVLFNSSASSSIYIWQNVINLYNGGNTDTKSYPEARITFKVKNVSRITALRFYSNQNFSTTYDGLSVISYGGMDLSVSPL
jgi:uncharacterized protein (TIGR02145 family)